MMSPAEKYRKVIESLEARIRQIVAARNEANNRLSALLEPTAPTPTGVEPDADMMFEQAQKEHRVQIEKAAWEATIRKFDDESIALSREITAQKTLLEGAEKVHSRLKSIVETNKRLVEQWDPHRDDLGALVTIAQRIYDRAREIGISDVIHHFKPAFNGCRSVIARIENAERALTDAEQKLADHINWSPGGID